MILNTADKIYFGSTLVDKVYLGSTLVYPLNVIRYPMDRIKSAWKFEDSALDSIGNNDGVDNNVSYIDGINGKSASFIGNDNKIKIPNNQSLNFTNSSGTADTEFSISTMVNFNSTPATNYFLAKGFGGGTDNKEYVLYTTAGNIFFQFYGIDYGLSLSSSFKPIVGTWYSVVVTFDKTIAILYVDGVEVGSIAPNGTPHGNYINTPLVFGGRGDNGFPFDGKMDTTALWDIALNADEVSNLNIDLFNGVFDDLLDNPLGE